MILISDIYLNYQTGVTKASELREPALSVSDCKAVFFEV
jgi:hypothetical protein